MVPRHGWGHWVQQMWPYSNLAVVLKTCTPKLSAVLHKLCWWSSNTGHCLTPWNIAQVYVQFTKNKIIIPAVCHPQNYCLPPIASKMMEGTIDNANRDQRAASQRWTEGDCPWYHKNICPNMTRRIPAKTGQWGKALQWLKWKMSQGKLSKVNRPSPRLSLQSFPQPVSAVHSPHQ